MRETKNAFLKMKQQTSKEKIKAIQWFLVGLIMVSLLSIVFLKPPLAHASEFPSDAITTHTEFTGNVTGLLLFATSTKTFLFSSFAQDPASSGQFWLYCGGVGEGFEMLETHKSDFVSIPLQMICNDAVYYTLTGFSGAGGHIILTYVARDVSTAPDPMAINTQDIAMSTINSVLQNWNATGFHISEENIGGSPAFGTSALKPLYIQTPATSTVATSNGFTYGEAMQILFLILIFILIFFKTIKEWVIGTKVENAQKNVTLKKYNDTK